ncbi:hypothetical protein MSHRCOH1_03745 [Candidatus Ornithobacterium hominis]|uniref:fibronectin type III domain-containing protein n=1 Tax=Candidatus Ornithobacterium hominis TaxID=2497989 RepID=UPI0024BCE7AE|nr:fibronectin type III domain-containing protein [Candidatus Ornithobacterium hominis]CAI9429303.1 hypothetical protein MSHRCOH1_03745 [Candidatus Ornithobacterium hominis]
MQKLYHYIKQVGNYARIPKKIIPIIFSFLLAFQPFVLKAQQYPVKMVPVLLPPYSLKLSEYATSTQTKLRLQVMMTDLQEPQHPTGMKFSLESSLGAVPIATSQSFVSGMSPFTLYPGSNITLTNVDLRPLFELQNLAGLNASQYAQTLPEGIYQFCFQAYDYYTKHNLSAKTCAQAYLTQYEPPLLNLPQNAEKVQVEGDILGSKGIVFQWMPRQVAPNTHYIFILKELWDAGRSPVAGFLSSPILWKEKTYATSLYYGPEKTRLIPGKRYAWQVQAVSGNPVVGANPTEDNGVYKNNGLSEIFYFDYVEDCKVPTFLMAKNAGRGRVELSWTMPGQPSGLYSIQYRKRDSNTDWQTEESYQTKYILTGLENQTEYEYRIGTVCGNLQNFNPSPLEGETSGNAYAYSAIQYFTTDSEEKESSKYQCGVMPSIDLTNKAPLQTALGTNEVFMAGDFPVTVISSQGSNGIYSGEGYIEVPYLGDTKIKVVFNNIKLNTDKQLIEGVVETTYNPNWENVVDIGDFIDGIKGLINDLKDKLNDGEELTNEEKEDFQIKGDKYYDDLNNQIDKLVADEKLTQEEADVLKDKLKESQDTYNNVLGTQFVSNDNAIINDAINALNDSSDKLKEVEEAINIANETENNYVLQNVQLIEFQSTGYETVEVSMTDGFSNCRNIFLPSGRLVKFSSSELNDIKKIGVNKGRLSYVIGNNNKKYNLASVVKTDTIKESNEIRVIKSYDADRLVCFDCIKKDIRTGNLPSGLEVIKTVDNDTIYKNIPKKYTIATFTSKVECYEGIQIIVEKEGGNIKCKSLSKEECENYKPQDEGESTTGNGTYVGTVERGSGSTRCKIDIYETTDEEGQKKYTTDVTLTGSPANSKVQAQEEELKAEVKRLAEEKLNELGLEGKAGKTVRERGSELGEFYVADMTGWEWVGEISELGNSVWETAALPKSYWNEDGEFKYNEAKIHMPPAFVGVSDGVIEEVTSYPQLIKLGYDVATKEEVRTGLWESVKGISIETIKDAAVDFYEEKKANYTSSKPYIVQHTVSKDAVQVASMLMGGGLSGGLKKGAKSVDDAVGKAGREILSEIDDVVVKELKADKLSKKLTKEAIEKGDFDKEIVEGLTNEANDIAAKKGRKLSWEEVKKLFKRGNDFNKKANAEKWYNFNEIHLANGKRLDSYDPVKKEIISRKATSLDKIKMKTFEGYLKEMKNKYPAGTVIRSNKYPTLDGQILQGRQILEIPISNQNLPNIQQYIDLAKSNKYNIELRFKPE